MAPAIIVSRHCSIVYQDIEKHPCKNVKAVKACDEEKEISEGGRAILVLRK